MRTVVAVVLLTFAALFAGCESAAPAPSATSTGPQQLALRTQPPPGPNMGCMDALASGRLDVDPRSGLGLRQPDGSGMSVAWPFGYTAWLIDGVPTLVDEHGQAIARAGNQVAVGGGMGHDNFWYTCAGQLTVTAP